MPALSLSVDLGNGIVPTYHRITSITMTLDPPQTTVTLTSFMAKAQSDDGAHRAVPGASRTFTFDGFPSGIAFATVQGWVYDQIKLRPEWASATKVA